MLLVGVRGHGGEEVYSALLRDAAPPGVETSATLDFHRSCPGGRCHALAEAALNRGLYPFLAFDLGFRVLGVGPEIDLVHVHSHPTVLRDRRRRPVVFSAGSSHYHCLRDYEGWSEGRIARRYARARRLYPRLGVLDALLNHEAVTLSYTFSSWAREAYLEHGVPAWKVRILPPGFPLPPPRRASPAEGVTFLFLGRAPGRKGGDLVLQAFARLRQTLPAARLLYVCEAPPPHPLPGVEALPLVPPGEVSVLYRRADVLVNPTRAEGFGFTNVEAQGHGLPVISTRIAAVPEVVENGRTGILVEPGDGAGVLEAMRRLGSESALRAEMGAAARARFETLFSLGVFRRGLGALYEEARDRAGA